MSNFLAIATVTAAIERLLSPSVEADVPGAKVVLGRPDTTTTGPVVNVFLYQIVTNPVRSNDDLPGRRGDSSLAQRPRAAVDLHYLLTFHGEDLDLEPQRLYGSVLRTLTTRPLITSALVSGVVAAAGGNPARHPSLADSDLADAPMPVRLTPLPMDLEQLSRLWGMFPQAAYALSSCWSASVVVVEGEDEPVHAAPVARSTLTVAPLARPRIDAVEDVADPAGPLLAARTWRVRGSQLSGDQVVVRVAGVELAADAVTASELLVTVGAAAGLRAGRVAVEVAHVAMLGTPPAPHGDLASAVHVVTLHPQVTGASATGAGPGRAVTVTPDIPVRARQRAALGLVDPSDGRTVRIAPAGPATVDATSVTAVLDVPPGSYAVVLTVDGADSPLERDGTGAVTGPLVVLS